MNDLSNSPSGAPAGGPAFEERMRQLRARFVDRSRSDAEEVRGVRRRLEAGEVVADDGLRHLFKTVHALAGAAGIFGFEAISEAAFRVERILRAGETAAEAIVPGLVDLEAQLDEVVRAG